ncbi:DUF29 domain-containing protein [Methylobacterium sp. J-090]|uniref:DUF29 domain-containing protein n=1 Tax=Methylobacterium sp. J-090 TaxID=2836666 RepID=UPI001FB8FBC9|nr:DUF29 domain-containing protein [Methylobacterium sp. J-090]MCJ2081324.1 DUF29 domain-containing protein [Methylobacterium sp. J-090]
MGEPAVKGETATMSSPERATHRARYEDDFYSWLVEQAGLLRANQLDDLDRVHVAEELEGLSKSEFAKLQSALRVLVMHMLKWDQQAEHRTRSWVFSIREQRRRYHTVLLDNPGLKPRVDEALARAYPSSRDWAAEETHLPLDEFPEECPYSWDELLERPFAVDPPK